MTFENQNNYELVANCDIMNDIIKDDMEKITIDDFKANTKEWLIDKLHGMIISDAIKTIGNIHDELHKPQYPKTYEECCDILGYKASYDLNNIATHDVVYDYKLQMLYRMLICRDAYWKIAGEQIGLDKSWKPDWTDNCQKKWTINFYQGEINLTNGPSVHFVLAFPTNEMRDAFYENFKDLIEECKELI